MTVAAGEMRLGPAKVAYAEPDRQGPGISALLPPLVALFVAGRIDTVLSTGATTPGRVRAPVADSVQPRLDTIVITDCCADRSRSPQ